MFNISLEQSDYLERENLMRFVPPFRKYHIKDGWLILITQITPLNKPRRKEEFTKYSDQKPVKLVQNFVWIKDVTYFLGFKTWLEYYRILF